MELIIAVLAVAAIVGGVVWTIHGLGLLRDFKGDADTKRRLLDLEVACHELKAYVDSRTPNLPPGGLDKGVQPPHIPGRDREIDGFGSEVGAGSMMGPGELEE